MRQTSWAMWTAAMVMLLAGCVQLVNPDLLARQLGPLTEEEAVERYVVVVLPALVVDVASVAAAGDEIEQDLAVDFRLWTSRNRDVVKEIAYSVVHEHTASAWDEKAVKTFTVRVLRRWMTDQQIKQVGQKA